MTTIPTLIDLYNGILIDYQTQFGVSINTGGKVFLRAKAAVQAAKLKLFYLALGNLQKNIWVDTADPAILGGTLERFGLVKLGRLPFAAIAGQYEVQLTAPIGAVIKASTTFKSDDSSLSPGMLFILDNAYTTIIVNDTIVLRALTSGNISKLNSLDTLTSTAPIPLVNSSVSVLTFQTIPFLQVGVVDPVDAEDIEIYREEIINSFRLSPQGGSAVDYRLWSQDAQGVERVYPFAAAGNEINLFVESTLSNSIDGKGTPSPTMLADVESVVEFNPDATLPTLERGRRPLGTWQVNYLPITIVNVDLVIQGYQGMTSAIQAQLLAAFTDAIYNIRPFVPAADILSERNDYIDVNKIIGIIITSQPGAYFLSNGITININGFPALSFQFTNGSIPYLNSVTYP